MTDKKHLQLGLIGGNIKASKAPFLHRLAGKQTHIDVQYDLLIPKEIGQDFDAVFAQCRKVFDGVNITYPFKEMVTKYVRFEDAIIEALGAVNTVVFRGQDAIGWNTDFSGFIKAYQNSLIGAPGRVVMLGAGGVGRAIGFALHKLGASEISIYDIDAQKAQAMTAELQAIGAHAVRLDAEPDGGFDGLVNCTPLGMGGIGGTPLSPENFGDAKWAFDAVYTPVQTQFLNDARTRGLHIISGYELFFYQGVDAWLHFSGRPVDERRLRAALEGEAAA